MSATPAEIIVGPFEIWLAPVAEAFPDVDEAPSGNWTKLGTGGMNNYSEDGVRVAMEQTMDEHYTAGLTAPVKATRARERKVVTVTLFDLAPTQLTKFFAGTAPTSVAAGSGTPGYDWFGLYRGLTAYERACLIRGTGQSPQDDGTAVGAAWNSQLELPRVTNIGNAELVFNKSDKAGVQFQLLVLADQTQSTAAEYLGRFISQDAEAL